MTSLQHLTREQRWARSQALVRAPGAQILQRWARTKAPSLKRTATAWTRAYGGAEFGPTTADWMATGTSADSEIYVSLRPLRNRSRQLIRDNEYAKNARRIVVNNVIGTGVGMESQVMRRNGAELDDKTNALIEREWKRWCRKSSCHTAGKLSLRAMQRFLMGNVFESGEILVRFVTQSFGESKVPLALELIEADQIVDSYSGKADNGNTVRMGVEVDKWQRPVAYYLHPKHPGDYSFAGSLQPSQFLRVPADEILHLGVFEEGRPYQTRCVPWLHITLKKLRHMGGYEEAEIVAARAAASIMGFRQTPDSDIDLPDNGDDDEDEGEESPVMNMAPGKILTLPPGETFQGFSPNRPNAALDPFMRFMLRSVAAGIGTSYESLSRDYSQSNYSSSRLALLDDRDGWRILQQWFLDDFMTPVFERWLDMAVLAGVLPLQGYEADPERFQAIEWQPRGWSWIDPAKEQLAAKSAVRSGHSTLSDDLAEQGKSIEAVFKRRRRELDLAQKYGLVLDTDPAQVNDKGAEQPKPQATSDSDGGKGQGKPSDQTEENE